MERITLRNLSFYGLLGIMTSCGSLSEWKQEIVQSPSWFEEQPIAARQPIRAPAATNEQFYPAAPQPVAASRTVARNWNSQALRVHSGALYAARDRWPWVQGYQLQRRAQILQLGPDFATLSRLDSNSNASEEIQILRELLEHRQRWANNQAD